MASKIAKENAEFLRQQELKRQEEQQAILKKKALAVQDPLITYLTLKSNHHNGKTDRKYVEEVYDDYAVKTEEKDNTSK